MLSYIEPQEAAGARRLIEESVGIPLPEMFGDFMAVKLYVRPEEIFTATTPEGKKIAFYLPESVRCFDKFRNCAALVIALGPACESPSFRVGDFIIIPRNEGTQVNYGGTVLHLLKYDKVYGVIWSPECLTRE